MKMTVRQRKIHEQAVELTSLRSRCEARLIANLMDNQKEKVFGCFGKTSVFDYLVDVLRWSEPVAGTFNTVFRKAMELHELAKAISEERVSICKASRIVSVLDESNVEELVQFAARNSWRAIESEMARRKPSKAGREKIKPINEELVEVKLYMTPKEAAQLRRAQDLLSSKQRKPASLSQAAAQSFKEYVLRHDPVKKAERAQARHEKRAAKPADSAHMPDSAEKSVRTDSASSQNPVRTESGPEPVRFGRKRRVKLTAEQNHAVNACDQGRCTFVDEHGNRCKNERWLEKHHKIKVSEGGSNDPGNLRTLCWFHHDMVHQLSPPIEGQVTWIKERVCPYGV
jgi:hypothetical protein